MNPIHEPVEKKNAVHSKMRGKSMGKGERSCSIAHARWSSRRRRMENEILGTGALDAKAKRF